MEAWRNGLKGMTIYRDGCARSGVLTLTDKKEEEKVEENKNEIPRGFIVPTNDNVIGLKRKIKGGCGSLHIQVYFDTETGDTYVYVGLKKDKAKQERTDYKDKFISPSIIQWESENNVTIDNSIGLKLKNTKNIYVFVRKMDVEDNIILPFTYFGTGKFTNMKESHVKDQKTGDSYKTLLFDIQLDNTIKEQIVNMQLSLRTAQGSESGNEEDIKRLIKYYEKVEDHELKLQGTLQQQSTMQDVNENNMYSAQNNENLSSGTENNMNMTNEGVANPMQVNAANGGELGGTVEE